MGRWLLCFFCLTLTFRSGLAAPERIRQVTFFTVPTGARVLDNYGHELGRSGQPLRLDLSKYSRESYLIVTFQAEGYRDRQEHILIANLTDRWPASGSLELESLSPRWLPWMGGVLGLGVLVGVWRGRRRVLKEARGEAVDSMVLRQVGPYQVVERLGEGGMATVYRGRSTLSPDGEWVAIKLLRKAILEEDFLARFRREAQITKRLNHPHIVRVLDWGDESEYAYLVLELLEGGTLRDRMRGLAIAPEEVWQALEPICSALSCAHQAGVVHRDLKPENLMITQNGTLKITDFGLAFTVDQSRLTQSGTTLGTPAYMPPEQIQGQPPDPAMDQYALGAVAYELLTGHPPFEAAEVIQLLFKVMTDPVAPPSQWIELSPEIDGVVLRMLAKNPADRYPSVEVAAGELKRVLSGG